MRAIELTSHTQDMLLERNILEEWVWRSIELPDRAEEGSDKNTHYLKRITENEGRVLHVVVNENVTPNRVVTVSFDRRYRGKI